MRKTKRTSGDISKSPFIFNNGVLHVSLLHEHGAVCPINLAVGFARSGVAHRGDTY